MEQTKIAVNCPTCNAELMQRSRLTLFLAGVALAAVAIVLVWLSQWLWLPAAFLVVVALYLAIWSGWAKGGCGAATVSGFRCEPDEAKPATSGDRLRRVVAAIVASRGRSGRAFHRRDRQKT